MTEKPDFVEFPEGSDIEEIIKREGKPDAGYWIAKIDGHSLEIVNVDPQGRIWFIGSDCETYYSDPGIKLMHKINMRELMK